MVAASWNEIRCFRRSVDCITALNAGQPSRARICALVRVDFSENSALWRRDRTTCVGVKQHRIHRGRSNLPASFSQQPWQLRRNYWEGHLPNVPA